jgi:hypothetical protein
MDIWLTSMARYGGIHTSVICICLRETSGRSYADGELHFTSQRAEGCRGPGIIRTWALKHQEWRE